MSDTSFLRELWEKLGHLIGESPPPKPEPQRSVYAEYSYLGPLAVSTRGHEADVVGGDWAAAVRDVLDAIVAEVVGFNVTNDAFTVRVYTRVDGVDRPLGVVEVVRDWRPVQSSVDAVLAAAKSLAGGPQ